MHERYEIVEREAKLYKLIDSVKDKLLLKKLSKRNGKNEERKDKEKKTEEKIKDPKQFL